MTSKDTLAVRRLALAWFDATGLTVSPPEWLAEAARQTAPSMPADLAPAMLPQPPFVWLHLASRFDFAGDLDGARLLLDRVERGARTLCPLREARELLALICARRGRLARQTGDVEAARDWYQLGLARTDGARNRDAWSSCLLGLANCAQFEHDWYSAERLARLVCINYAVVPAYSRVNALITLSVLHQKQQRWDAALRISWQVHDLVPERDERRGTALIQLSNLALERGESGAAQRGFDVVLSFAQSTRVRRPALSGALSAALAQWRARPDAVTHRAVHTRIHALRAEIQGSTQPWERVNGWLDALHALQAIGEVELAKQEFVSLESELTALAMQGARLEWAEQRLQRLRVERTRSAETLTDVLAFPCTHSVAEIQAFHRLGALAPLT